MDTPDFLNELGEILDNPFAMNMDQLEENQEFVDSGSYALNMLISGSFFKGWNFGRINAIAGEQATGKTFFALNAIREFQKQYPKSATLYFDTENAVSKHDMINRGIDPSKVRKVPVGTVEEFATSVSKLVRKYGENHQDHKLLIVLDSLGMLASIKESEDTYEGNNKRDMTRAQKIRSAFRVLTLECGKYGVPMIVTNHTYKTMDLFPTNEISGMGLKYAASTIVMLGKRKDKVGKVRIGSIIPCKTYKSRFTQEEKTVMVGLRFDRGLMRYSGLLDIAKECEFVKKKGNRWELPNGVSKFEKEVNEKPEEYWTTDMLEALEKACCSMFRFGDDIVDDSVYAEESDVVKEVASEDTPKPKKRGRKKKGEE